MSFERFPYTNFHELNLDWIVQKLKEAYSSENPPDYPVKSVNGMTGDVILAIPSIYVHSVNGETGDVVLYRNPLTQFPATDETRWNLFRICDGTEKGIEFDANSAKRIAGTRRILIYDEDNPPDYPVTSVNGQTGDVQITAGVQSVNGKTGNVVTPFVNPNTDILTLDSNSPSILWGISRNVAGGNVALYITTGGTNPQAFIRYTPDGGQAINLPLLTNADIPESAGVVSVNGKSGVVTLYGTDILTSADGSSNIYNDITRVLSENAVINDNILGIIYGAELLESGGINPITGQNSTSELFCRTINYIPESCTRISDDTPYLKFSIYAYDKTNDNYIGRYTRNNDFQPISTEDVIYLDNSIDMAYFFSQFPNYKFRFIVTIGTSGSTVAETPIESVRNIKFINSLPQLNTNEINALKNDLQDAEDAIAQIQTEGANRDRQITALQAKDTTHDQQISALQTETNSYSQQIAELYTKVGAGIKEVKFTDVVSLPIRYPETGTDADITENMACVNAILSRPGVQRTNLTIVFYNGYLTISGTIQGLTDIILYLTKT